MASNEIKKEETKTYGHFKSFLAMSPYVALIIVPLLWGSSVVIGKHLVDVFPPFLLTTCRFLIAFLIFFPILLVNPKSHIPAKLTVESWALLVFLGITGVFAFNPLLYTGLNYTSPVNATLIDAVNPTMTVLLSAFIFREKLGGKKIAALFLAFLGLVWIAFRGSPANLISFAFNRGDLLIFLGACIWAVYSVGVKKAVHILSPLATVTLSMFFGLLFLFPFAYLELTTYPIGPITWKIIFTLVYLGIFPSVLAFWLWNWGIALVGPSKAAMFYYLIPLFAAVMSYFSLGETPELYHLVGGVLILWGVIWGARLKK